jgi:predicted PolB exonuclease-like 3'-5' exonuclease
MTPTLVFDLETIPDVEGLRRLHGWGPEVQDAEVAQRAFAARKELTGSDFLPLHLQRVAVVGCVFRDDQGFRVRCLGQADDSEHVLLSGFFKTIERYTPKLVSWNGNGFDLPVLHYRSLIHSVVAPRYWDTGDDDREFRYNNYLSRYHTRHVDLMDVLAKHNGRGNAPLDDLAKLCGFPGKMGMDGSQVWHAWTHGQAQEVRAYCETDVVNTWLVYCRFRLLRGELDTASYEAEIALVRETLEQSTEPHWKQYLEAWGR